MLILFVFGCISSCSVTLRVVVSILDRPLFSSTVVLLLVSHWISVLCHSYSCCLAFTGFLWFILSNRCYIFLRPIWPCSPPSLCPQLGLMRCWSVTRSSIWAWWRIWGWGEPASLTDDDMRFSYRGDHILIFFSYSNVQSHVNNNNPIDVNTTVL